MAAQYNREKVVKLLLEFGEEVVLPGQPDLGLHIIESVMRDEFDVAHSRVLPNGRGEGHAFGFVHRRVLNKRHIPTVPIIQNTFYPSESDSGQATHIFFYPIGKNTADKLTVIIAN